MSSMKSKLQRVVQPVESLSAPNQQVQAEIECFLQALDSYPARVAKEPRLSFYRYLGSFFEIHSDGQPGNRSRY